MRPQSLSPVSRGLTWAVTVACAVLGAVLFVAPGWAAPRFTWQVTELMVMSIGAWFISNAIWGWRILRDWCWARVGSGLVYLWCFGLLQAGVLTYYHDKVRLTSWVAWLYLSVITLLAITGLFGFADVVRLRPEPDAPGRPFPVLFKALSWGFVVFVSFLFGTAMLRPEAAVGGGVFPEDMSAFTVRSFGVYFFALVLGVLVVLRRRTLEAVRSHMAGGLGITAPILIASIVHLDVFDFSAHPRQWIYIGSYVAVVVISVPAILFTRPRTEQGAGSSASSVVRPRPDGRRTRTMKSPG